MTQNSDLPDELPPTESQVVFQIEAALDNVLDDLGLDPDQKSIKYEKYVYLTSANFPPYDEPAISHSWFQWGISTLAGQGGESPNERLFTNNASAQTILQAESDELESFIKEGIPNFPIKEWWEKPEFEFLKGFYQTYADDYQRLYLANIELLESIEFVGYTVQREEDLITEQTYRNACDWTIQLEQEVASFPYLQADYDVLRFFTELYRDVVLSLVNISGEEIKLGQQTAVNELTDLYEEIVWPLLSHRLSEATASGPNKDKIEFWADHKHGDLMDDFLDTKVSAICDSAGLLREFKTYPSPGDSIEPSCQDLKPPMVTVLEHREGKPTIDDFIENHSLRTLASIVDLTPDYADGKLTYRGVANAVEISYDAAFEMLEVLVPLLVGEQETETLRPEDIDEETRSEYISGVDI